MREKWNLFDELRDFNNVKDELIVALETLEADQELIDIIISWRSDCTDEETYHYLKAWNDKCPKSL